MADGKIWSQEVLDIFHTFQTTSDNISISACPGAGKTTVLEALWSMNPYQSTLYLAFNKNIVKEAQEKLPSKVDSHIKTFNSFGHSVCASQGYIFDRDKISKILRSKFSAMQKRYRKGVKVISTESAVRLLVSKMQLYNNFMWSLDEIKEVVNLYNLEIFPGMIDYAYELYELCLEDTKTMDYSDQILHPVFHSLPLPEYDLILIDEYQDLNEIQLALLDKLKGRKVFVGDPHQSVYGFRGSMHNIGKYIHEDFETIEKPMTLSYRCAEAVVKEAQHYYPNDIQALPDAMAGFISYQDAELITPKGNDLILCRVNAPLMEIYFDLIRRGISAYIQGRNYGESLTNYVNSFIVSNIEELFLAMNDDCIAQTTEEKRAFYQERNDTLLAIFLDQPSITIEAFKDKIRWLFIEREGAVCLSSIHRAKGLEAENVFLLEPDLCDKFKQHKNATEVSIAQENNLMYVAITRAKSTFTYVTVGG